MLVCSNRESKTLFGFNIHTWGGPSPIPFLVATGSKIYRLNSHWDGSSTVWSLPIEETLMRDAVAAGIVPMHGFIGNNIIMGTSNQTAMKAWIASLVTKAKAIGANVFYHDNEQVNRPVAEYLTGLNNAYSAMRNASTTAVLCAPESYGETWGDNKTVWFDGFLAGAGNNYDVYATHPYEANTMSSWIKDMSAICAKVRAKRPGMKISMGEIGWSTALPSVSAQMVPLAVMEDNYASHAPIARCFPGLVYAMGYTLKNNGTNTAARDDMCGLYDANWVPRGNLPAIVRESYDLAHRATSGDLYASALNSTNADWVARLTIDGSDALVVVNPGSTHTMTINVTAAAAGTMTIKPIGRAAISRALNPGAQDIAISIGPRATVLTSNVPVSFRDYPVAGGSSPPPPINYEAIIMDLTQRLNDAIAELEAIKADAAATEAQRAAAEAKVASLTAKIDAAKAALQ